MSGRRLKTVYAYLEVVMLTLVIGGSPLHTIAAQATSPNDPSSFADFPLYTWTRIDLSDETMCSNASEYYMNVRRGEANHLIIHLVGGGMAWDAESSSQPITLTNLSGYYFASIWEITRAFLDGIFQHQNSENPFRDWNVVHIPYCTADFHIGAATNTYSLETGDSITIHHNGRQNVTEALDWVLNTFSQPEKILISGDSAGGFGSILWMPYIAQHYPHSEIYQLADGAYLETPHMNEIVEDVWQADFQNHFGFEAGDDLAGNAYVHYGEIGIPNVTYLHINTLYDEVLIRFAGVLNDVSDDDGYRETWSQRMRASMAENANANPDYFYYLTDYGLNEQTETTPHTSISFPLFYEITEEDVYLHNWLRRIVIDGERFSVGAEFLP